MRVQHVEQTVSLGDHSVALLRPREAEALIDEQAFERDEFLPYWAELWPSAIALAHDVAGRTLRGARVLELGCGLALPSIAAAIAGARATASDWAPDALALVCVNAARNGVAVTALRADWSAPDALLDGAPWDVVLASDVLYERRNAAILARLLPRLVNGGEILLADPGRPPAAAFLAAAVSEWCVESRSAPLAPFVRLHTLRRR